MGSVPHFIDLETKASNILSDMAPLGDRGVGEADPLNFNAEYAENVKLNLDLEGTNAADPSLNHPDMFGAGGGMGRTVFNVVGSLVLLTAVVIGGSYYLDDPLHIMGNLTDFGRRLALWVGLETDRDLAQVVKRPGDTGEKKPAPVAAPPPAPAPVELKFNAKMVENPYWFLPIQPVKAAPLGGELSSDEAERWEAGLGHEFMYQRYKAVKEIRKSHAKGSDNLLFEALEDPKLWTRMEALLALVELGATVDGSLTEKALHEKRSSLVKNYFKRFYDAPPPSAVFIMKQAIRVVKAPARLVILQNLLHSHDADASLYLAAAGYDPNPKVRDWVLSSPRNYNVTDGVMRRYQNLVVDGWKKGEGSASAQSSGAMGSGESLDDNDIIKNVTIQGHAIEDKTGIVTREPKAVVRGNSTPAQEKKSFEPKVDENQIHPEEYKVEDGFDTLKANDVTFTDK